MRHFILPTFPTDKGLVFWTEFIRTVAPEHRTGFYDETYWFYIVAFMVDSGDLFAHVSDTLSNLGYELNDEREESGLEAIDMMQYFDIFLDFIEKLIALFKSDVLSQLGIMPNEYWYIAEHDFTDRYCIIGVTDGEE